MGTWKSVAGIQVSQIILDVHLLAAHHLVGLHHGLVRLTLLAAPHALIQVDLHHDHQDRIQIAVVKIYRRAVVQHLGRVHRGETAKGAMQMIHVEFVQRQWIVINQDYVQEF